MIGFHALLPPGLTTIALIIVLFVLLWREWKRKARFIVFRIIAEVVMLFALGGIILRPTYQAETTTEILLLTAGYTPPVVDSLLAANPALDIRRLPNTTKYDGSTLLNSYHDLPEIRDNITMIAGHGLPPYARDMMEGISFTFYPGLMPPGVNSLFVPEGIQYRTQQISGTFHNTSGKQTIYLNNPGGKEDSVEIHGPGEYPFQLSFTPRLAGDLLYSLVIVDSLKNKISENIPIHVEPPAPLNILFVQGYPTFETQYLKTFLSQKHHRLALRYQVSQQAFRYEYANRPSAPLGRFTKSMLDEFDLLILSDDALQKMTAAEKSLIKAAIRNGLGVLTLSPSKAADFLPALKSVRGDTAMLRVGVTSVALPVASVRVAITSGLQTVTQNTGGVLSGYVNRGEGKIGFQFLQDTYRLALSGDSTAYSALWTPLIEGIAKQHAAPSFININSQFPYYPDEPIDVTLITQNEDSELWADSIQLPLREDVLIDGVWHATLWADAPGWHKLYTMDGADLSFYVSVEDGWRALSIANHMAGTELAEADRTKSSPSKTQTTKEIRSLYFFLAFLLSAGFLWLAPKL